MSVTLKLSKPKSQAYLETWIEPEPIAQPPGSTGYPLGTPPPQKLLPKNKRRQTHPGGQGIHPDKITSQLTCLASRRHSSVKERRSRSTESDEASKSSDEFEGSQVKDYHTSKASASQSQTPSSSTPKDENQPPSPGIHDSIQDQLATKLLTHLTESITQPSSIRKSLRLTKFESSEENEGIIIQKSIPKEKETQNLNGRRGKRQNGVAAAKRIRETLTDESPPPVFRGKRQKRFHEQYVMMPVYLILYD